MKRVRLLSSVCVIPVLFGLTLAGCGNPSNPDDKDAPQVAITQPSEGQSFAAGTKTVRAHATDNEAVTKVEFFDGEARIGEGTRTGADDFRINWSAVPGTHTLRAVASDAAGNTGEDAISVTALYVDEQPPTVSILEPAAGAHWDAEGVVRIRASAGDNAGVTAVQFFDGSTAIGEDGSPEGDVYETDWSAMTGAHMLRAVASDGAGNVGADTVFVTVGTVWGVPEATPNPFCPDSGPTTIAFTLQVECDVTIKLSVWNTSGPPGDPVRRLVDGHFPAGMHSVIWDGTDDAGQRAAAGDYCCGMSAHDASGYYIFPCSKVTLACPPAREASE